MAWARTSEHILHHRFVLNLTVYSAPVVLTDANGVVYGVRARHPGGNYAYHLAEATKEANKLQEEMDLPDAEFRDKHKRGNFACVSFGLSHARNVRERLYFTLIPSY